MTFDENCRELEELDESCCWKMSELVEVAPIYKTHTTIIRHVEQTVDVVFDADTISHSLLSSTTSSESQ
jgi:hypothetical protein